MGGGGERRGGVGRGRQGRENVKHLQLFIQLLKLNKIWCTDLKLKNKIIFLKNFFFIFTIVFE